MAESRSSLLAKSVQKYSGRAKEKILQNLGKVDRTADDIFDEHLQNFTRQQNAANRLQKEFSNYIRCIRTAQVAAKSLLEAIGDIYESQWSGHDLLFVHTQSVDMLWQDFSHKLADQVLIPLNTYQSQFPEMRKKIDKRGRKLVDYDGQRHNFQALQTNMAKKRDEVKISKGREQLDEAKRTYEILNSELHDELPALYDSRILFLVTNLQTLFNAEHLFHSETAKVYGELEAIVDKLATESQRGSYSVKKTNGATSHMNKTNDSHSHIINNVSPIKNNPTTPGDMTPPQTDPPSNPSPPSSSPPESPAPQIPTSPPKEPSTPTTTNNAKNDVNGVEAVAKDDEEDNNKVKEEKESAENSKSIVNSENIKNGSSKVNTNKRVEELYDIPVGANTENLPPGVLYRVKATYKYNREDVDELSFDVGEIINVVEYDDPEEQEEGWLMGIKQGTAEKGMFPANFTRPL